jgi:hypothetical protein
MTEFHRFCRDRLVADGWSFHASHLRQVERVTAFRGHSLEKFNYPTAFEAWAEALSYAQIQSEIDRLNAAGVLCHERDTRAEAAE